MNNKFYTYQRRDNPNCGYGMTGEIIFGGEDGREILFSPDDGTLAFQSPEKDIFGLEKNWRKKLKKQLSDEDEAWETCLKLLTGGFSDNLKVMRLEA